MFSVAALPDSSSVLESESDDGSDASVFSSQLALPSRNDGLSPAAGFGVALLRQIGPPALLPIHVDPASYAASRRVSAPLPSTACSPTWQPGSTTTRSATMAP